MKKFGFYVLTIAGSVALYEYCRRHGIIDQIKGDLKQRLGEATDDTGLKAEGFVDSVKGEAKETVEDVKDSVKDTAEDVKDAFR